MEILNGWRITTGVLCRNQLASRARCQSLDLEVSQEAWIGAA
jgi:hypothetical protein